METIIGKYNSAICYTNIIENTAREQIKTLCDTKVFSDSKIRIMPDVHAFQCRTRHGFLRNTSAYDNPS